MATSWKQNGIKGNHFYDKVVTEARIEKLQKDLAEAGAKDISTIITDTFKKLK